jgi:hypothetical protein
MGRLDQSPSHMGGRICAIIVGAGCLQSRVFARGHVLLMSCRVAFVLWRFGVNSKGQVRAKISAFSFSVLPLTRPPTIISMVLGLVSDRRIRRASREVARLFLWM